MAQFMQMELSFSNFPIFFYMLTDSLYVSASSLLNKYPEQHLFSIACSQNSK